MAAANSGHAGFVSGGRLVTGAAWQASVNEAVIEHNTFVDILDAPRAAEQSRSLRRHQSEGDARDLPPSQQLRRLNLSGDSAPGSQDVEMTESPHTPTPPRRRAATATDADNTAADAMTNAGYASILSCRLCTNPLSRFEAKDSKGLLQHISRMHMGEALNAAAVSHLDCLGKGCCVACGQMRSRATAHCSQCRLAMPTRELRGGDRVPDRRQGATESRAGPPPGSSPGDTREAGTCMGSDSPEGSGPRQPSTQAALRTRTITLPDDWEARTKRLRECRQNFIPACIATKFGESWREGIAGCLNGDPAWSQAAPARCKLLLAPVPKHLDFHDELKERLRMLEGGFLAHLLLRIEGQQAEQRQAE